MCHDWDPFYAENDPGHYDDERFEVAMGNRIYVTACWSCFTKWSPRHKRRYGELAPSERDGLLEALAA